MPQKGNLKSCRRNTERLWPRFTSTASQESTLRPLSAWSRKTLVSASICTMSRMLFSGRKEPTCSSVCKNLLRKQTRAEGKERNSS